MAVHKKYDRNVLGRGLDDIGNGRGLDALIDTGSVSTQGSSNLSEIELSHIEPNPNQPRREFDEEALQELAASIREIGIIQPITLRKVADELGTNLPVLSMAWILQHPEISCVIAGASKPSQLENNMKAAGFVIPADAMAEIDKITGFHRFERHVG